MMKRDQWQKESLPPKPVIDCKSIKAGISSLFDRACTSTIVVAGWQLIPYSVCEDVVCNSVVNLGLQKNDDDPHRKSVNLKLGGREGRGRPKNENWLQRKILEDC